MVAQNGVKSPHHNIPESRYNWHFASSLAFGEVLLYKLLSRKVEQGSHIAWQEQWNVLYQKEHLAAVRNLYRVGW